MKLLCKLGFHRPLKNHTYSFTDSISGKSVYDAVCSCGYKFMVDSSLPYGGFKVDKLPNKAIHADQNRRYFCVFGCFISGFGR